MKWIVSFGSILLGIYVAGLALRPSAPVAPPSQLATQAPLEQDIQDGRAIAAAHPELLAQLRASESTGMAAPQQGLSGWYLMLPPASHSGDIYPELPLARWITINSFDSADQCMTWRQEVEDAPSKNHDRSDRAFNKAMPLSECINASDPRLK
jgi:hypothetical protein